MLRRPSLFVLLASSLTFLVSLFLPWLRVAVPPPTLSHNGIPGLTGEGGQVDGWVSGAGDVAVLIVIAVVIACIAALRRPDLAARLPIASLGVALGYFAVATAVTVHGLGPLLTNAFKNFHTSWTYGFYLGLASAGVALISGLVYRRNEIRWPGVAEAAATVVGIGLLVSFLLPWFDFAAGPVAYHFNGVELAATAIAALTLVLGAAWMRGEARRRWRLPLAIASAVLTAGAANEALPTTEHSVRLYGTWMGIGCAVALVALEAVRAWPVRLPVLPRGLAAVRLGAAALLLVALFLPWQEVRTPGTIASGANGWYSSIGVAAGSLCLLLFATPALPKIERYVLDAAVAIALFVSGLATAFRGDSFIFHIGYGAFVGIAAAGALLATALVPLRPRRVDSRRALERAVPLAASILCVAGIVVPWWFVLPQSWDYQAPALNNWFAVPGLLLALYLVRLWAVQMRRRAPTGSRLTLVPLVLLTLPSLELIRYRNSVEALWGAIILVGLCVLLAVFGWFEEDRGLEGLHLPEEIWRVDRLPDAEN